MPSPFVGMDPYLEAADLWPGFHNDLAAEIRAALNARIQPKYVALLEAHVVYEVVEVSRTRAIRPDVSVIAPELNSPSGVATAEVAVTPAPVVSMTPLDLPLELMSVEIRLPRFGTLVTVIEILSPTNKRPGDQAYADYQRKRRELLHSDVHLLEIDLLRAGERPPLVKPVPTAPYYVTLSRAEQRPSAEVWPINLGDALPVVPVPLAAPDPDVPLDLGSLVARVYERGGYASLIDYAVPPPI